MALLALTEKADREEGAIIGSILRRIGKETVTRSRGVKAVSKCGKCH
jgi:hypothetical protein